ncbi:DMT family transporter [Nitrospirillum iridis]|uniref:Drug/metabolite transporter (DMT)-like permease n=1 Tax=Nitrospirillum iridis TaxID=765888 RepID=A0A7X0B027_9PROT|nr:DMT family transporter [Nitrospirillum iridis]MBB6251886.1 drug/metabolite transporter (DMT)-like permease [Nitrospirillum iridis]
MKMDRAILAGMGYGVLAGAFWGTVFLGPRVLHAFSPMQLSASRYLLYGLISVVLILPRWRALAPKVGRTEALALLRLSLLGNIVYYVFVASAVHLAGVAATSLIIGLLPMAVTLVGSREQGAVPLRALVLPLALGAIGVSLIGIDLLGRPVEGGLTTAQRLLGLACAAGALVSWTLYAVLNSRWLTRLPSVSAHDWSLLTGVATGTLALGLAAPAFLWGGVPHAPGDWALFWGVSGGVAIGASVLGNAFWNRASRLLPLTLTGQMILFETLFALLYGFLWDGRWPTLMEGLAILALVASVALCVGRHHRQPQAASEAVTPEAA